MAHHVGFLDAQRIHQTDAVFGKKPGCVVHVRFVAPAQAAMIIDQNLIVLGKLRHLRDPPGGETDAGAGDQHQRIALPVKLVVEIYVVDFDFAAFDRLESSMNSLSML